MRRLRNQGWAVCDEPDCRNIARRIVTNPVSDEIERIICETHDDLRQAHEALRDAKVGLVCCLGNLGHGYLMCNEGMDTKCFVCEGLKSTQAVLAAAVVGAGSEPKATKLPGENLRDSGMADAGGVSDGPQ